MGKECNTRKKSFQRHEDKQYKCRLANEDTKVGKSNGYRELYAVFTDDMFIYIIDVYYKKEQESVDDSYIDGLIQGLLVQFTEEKE